MSVVTYVRRPNGSEFYSHERADGSVLVRENEFQQEYMNEWHPPDRRDPPERHERDERPRVDRLDYSLPLWKKSEPRQPVTHVRVRFTTARARPKPPEFDGGFTIPFARIPNDAYIVGPPRRVEFFDISYVSRPADSIGRTPVP